MCVFCLAAKVVASMNVLIECQDKQVCLRGRKYVRQENI